MSQVAAKHTFLESRIEFGNFVCCNCSVACCTVMFIFFVTFIFAADKIIRCYLQIPEKSFPSLREQQYFVAVSCQSNIEKMCSVLYCYNVPTEMTFKLLMILMNPVTNVSVQGMANSVYEMRF